VNWRTFLFTHDARLGDARTELRGKIALNVGMSDNLFLNDSVYLRGVSEIGKDRPPDATVDYGLRASTAGVAATPTSTRFSRLTYSNRFIHALRALERTRRAERTRELARTGRITNERWAGLKACATRGRCHSVNALEGRFVGVGRAEMLWLVRA